MTEMDHRVVVRGVVYSGTCGLAVGKWRGLVCAVLVSRNPAKSKDAFEGEEIEQSKKNRDFKALEKREKNGGVGMLLRCLRIIENRHPPELRLPMRKKDAPMSFIGLVISTIKMLSGRDELHLVNKH
ncbi:unnamed protein product [Sphagnum tenellum]